jgi:broad specificity phosphatase PhoE
MPTTKIMVIRHAEKPNGEPGVMPDGSENAEALTATGWKRAEALVGLFAPADGRFTNPHLATPQTIFASGVSEEEPSLRPQQTVTPLAEKLGLHIRTDFPRGDEAELVEAAVAIGGVVLIAWQHEDIPDIAGDILGSDQGVPEHWKGHRFDLAWVFDRPDGGDRWTFIQVPQLLLPGDSDKPIGMI